MLNKATQKKSLRIFIHYLLGPILFAWVCYSIYLQIQKQPGLDESWRHIKAAFTGMIAWNLVLVFLLMLINWALESLKWKMAVERIQKISFIKAFFAVLSGVSFSVSTPNRVGEYLGRVLYLNEGNRIKAIALTITGSLSQLIITMVMGLAGLISLRPLLEQNKMAEPSWLNVAVYGVSIFVILLTLFYFRLSVFIKWIDNLPAARRFSWIVEALEQFNATLLFKILSLSAVRFTVFILQYYLLFRLFDVEVSFWISLTAVSFGFLVMAAIPTVALFTDLGIRSTVILELMNLFSENSLGISLTVISIWFINLILPALAGSLFIVGIKKASGSENGEFPVKG